MSRIGLFAVVALVALGCAPLAQAQRPGDPMFTMKIEAYDGMSMMESMSRDMRHLTDGLGKLALASDPSVQAEIQLDAQQVKTIVKRRLAYQDAFEDVRRLDDKTLELETGKLRAANDRTLANVLTTDQMTRLQQLWVQDLGIRAFGEPDVARALSLTNSQRVEIKAIETRLREKRAELSKHMYDAQDVDAEPFESPLEHGENVAFLELNITRDVPASFQHMIDTASEIEDLVNNALDEALDLLTPAQRNQWNQLRGEPFDLKAAELQRMQESSRPLRRSSGRRNATQPDASGRNR